MRSFDSIVLRLRRNTNRAFVPHEGAAAPGKELGPSLGSYFFPEEHEAEWTLFRHGVWDRKDGRFVLFSEVDRVLPETLTSDYKLLHFSPTLVIKDAPLLHLRCQGRERGQLNHGWAIRDALSDVFMRLNLHSSPKKLS